MDDPGAVERVIDRLKEELEALSKVTIKWGKHPDDDCEAEFSISYRHDMIRTLLRFLSYSIIRNDPSKYLLLSCFRCDQFHSELRGEFKKDP